ncbi:MAG: DUF2796 domain-containing protein [Bdellovibrionota bacterium]
MKFFVAILFLSCVAVAHEKNREHGAHAHGAGTLGIAFEGTKCSIEFKIPNETLFGFEYKAKSAKDKKKRDDALSKLESKISEMLVFDSSLNCKIEKNKIEVIAESDKHSSTMAVFSIICDKSPLGTEITFNFQKQFPKIKDLDVQFIVDNLQKSVEVKKNDTKLFLK